MKLILDNEIQNSFSDKSNLFDQIMSINGEMYRKMEKRETYRFEINDKPYFIKKHSGVRIMYILKNLFQRSRPAFSSQNEANAILHLQNVGINTPIITGYGKKGFIPHKIKSFIITKELTDTKTLSDLLTEWETEKPVFTLKKLLIEKLAHLVRKMHESGLNHKDCYLVHFHINNDIKTQMPIYDFPIYVIDLHRAQIRKKIPNKWLIKDIGALYFSSKYSTNLTKRDLFRFLKIYTGKNLRQIFDNDLKFWKKVKAKGEKVYKRHQRNFPFSHRKERKILKKIFNNSTDFLCKKSHKQFMVWRRKYQTDEMMNFLSNIEEYLTNYGVKIKQSNLHTVIKIKINDKDLIVKRYDLNEQSLWYCIKQYIKTKTRKCWYNSNRLQLYGILTPEPIALLEKKYSLANNVSYFISEYIEGISIKNDNEKLKDFINQGNTIMETLQKLYLCHHDLNPNNFILKNDKLYLIDLDKMSRYLFKSRINRAVRKEKESFLKKLCREIN